MRIIGGLVGWMSPWAKILGGGLEPLGPHEVGAYVHPSAIARITSKQNSCINPLFRHCLQYCHVSHVTVLESGDVLCRVVDIVADPSPQV